MRLKKIKIIGIYRILNSITNNSYIGSSIDVYNRLAKHKSWLKNNKHQNKHLQNAVNKYNFKNFTFTILEECLIDELVLREQKYIDKEGYYNITKLVERNIPSKESRLKHSITKKKMFKEGLISKPTKKIYQYNLNGEFIKEWNSLNEASFSNNVHVSTIIRCLNKTYKSAKKYVYYYEFKGNKIEPIIISKKEINTNSRSKRVILTNINTNEILTFDSIKLCCKNFSTTHNNFMQYYYKNINFKSLYKIDLVKLDKLLETPEEDNQQPIISLND